MIPLLRWAQRSDVGAMQRIRASVKENRLTSRALSEADYLQAIERDGRGWLILRTLLFGPQHGQAIARAIQQQSGDTLLVDHGSLYPALQRLEERGWIEAEWGTSENNRKARFYELTKSGRRQLVAETKQWRLLSTAIGRILGPEEG